MSATSVTGKGQGMSNGEYKPELQCGGCGCGFTEEEEPSIIAKRGCVTKTISGGTASCISSESTSIKVC